MDSGGRRIKPPLLAGELPQCAHWGGGVVPTTEPCRTDSKNRIFGVFLRARQNAGC